MSKRTFRIANGIYPMMLGILLLGGFGALPAYAGGNDHEEHLETAGQSVISGWTEYTSEEYPPVECDGTSLVSAVQCTGSYCDNMRMHCEPTLGLRLDSYWSPYFSDDPPTSQTYHACPPGYWVTGLSCLGRYCDNVSLQCTRIPNLIDYTCMWTRWTSEESGSPLRFVGPYGTYYARGAQCEGAYCDNIRFKVCIP